MATAGAEVEAASEAREATEAAASAEEGTAAAPAAAEDAAEAAPAAPESAAAPAEGSAPAAESPAAEAPAAEEEASEEGAVEGPAAEPQGGAKPAASAGAAEPAEQRAPQMQSENGKVLRNGGPVLRGGTPSSNLGLFLTEATVVGAVLNADGQYELTPGQAYEIKLKFEENESLQFTDEQQMSYTLPAGLQVGDTGDTTFDIDIIDSDGSATISGNTFRVQGGKVFVNFNKNDPNFARLKALSNVEFKVSITARLDENLEEIGFAANVVIKFFFRTRPICRSRRK